MYKSTTCIIFWFLILGLNVVGIRQIAIYLNTFILNSIFFFSTMTMLSTIESLYFTQEQSYIKLLATCICCTHLFSIMQIQLNNLYKTKIRNSSLFVKQIKKCIWSLVFSFLNIVIASHIIVISICFYFEQSLLSIHFNIVK